MNQWPIGLSTGCFYYRSFFDVIDAIHASGFRQIEICSFPRHLDYHREDDVRRAGDRLRQLDLHPFSFHAPFADHIDITSFDERVRRAAVDELLVACRAAALMGVRHIVLHPGPERAGRPPEHEFLQHMKLAAESLNTVAKHCTELGLHLLLENMLPHLLFGHTADMLYLVGEIREQNVGTCLDTGHANLAGELGSVVQKLSGHLKMLHVNDNRGNSDAHLCPGDGIIDWHSLLADLRKHHFKGSLILELSSSPDENPTDVLARARRAADYLIESSRTE
ncbi:MAG TPA: sugar phosphate isomerase/epimerase family protein [Prosthecobacter sp.]|nr:sugar phosphate isomerase/epimerase family protein [Prosthecobacter sp.]